MKLFRAFFSAALGLSLIASPALAEGPRDREGREQKSDQDRGEAYTNRVITLAVLFLGAVTVILVLAAPLVLSYPRVARQLRREAKERGLDPNLWFGNVERVASERIGRETVTYVSNIFKYYIAYRLLAEQEARRDAARASAGKTK